MTLGKPASRKHKKRLEPWCLVLYPANLEQNYTKIYGPAIQEMNLEPVTLTKVITTAPRITKVQKLIERVKFVIADVSGRDKDVLFRAGLAEAAGKPVGIIAQSIEDIPSDLQHTGYSVYEIRSPSWAIDLQRDIQSLIEDGLGAKR